MTNKPIRVLQVGMSPYYGGTEAFIMNQYRRIDRSLVQFDFLNVYKEKIACQDEIEAMGGKIYYLDMARHNGLKVYYEKLDKFFKDNSPNFDAIHCNFQSLINIDALKYAKKYNIPVRIAHAHNAGYGTEPNFVQKLLIKKNFYDVRKSATHYFACSTLAAEWMFKRDATVIKNAIDIKKFVFSPEKRTIVRQQLGLRDEFTAIFVGRLDPQKNPLFLIEVFNEIKKINSSAKLLMIGDGIMKEEIVAKIAEFKLDDAVMMLGSRNDVDDLLQASDAFILPSVFEGLGIVLIEAQATGLKTYTSEDVVPVDVAVTPLLKFISLKKSPEHWAKIITEDFNGERPDTKDLMYTAGFDSCSNAKILEELYLSFFEKFD